MIGLPWEPDWEVYGAGRDELPLLIATDLNAAGRRLDSHPYRLHVRIKMQDPAPDGLRSADEAGALFDLEDRVADRLEPLGAVPVGRSVFGGITDLVWYLPDALDDPLEGVDLADYETRCTMEHDPGWAFVADVLAPGPYDHEDILNRRLLLLRADQDDRPEVVRRVDHLVVLPSSDAADRAAELLSLLGYEADPPRGDGDRWLVRCQRDSAVDEATVRRTSREILDVVLPLGGSYDGWGAEIIR